MFCSELDWDSEHGLDYRLSKKAFGEDYTNGYSQAMKDISRKIRNRYCGIYLKGDYKPVRVKGGGIKIVLVE